MKNQSLGDFIQLVRPHVQFKGSFLSGLKELETQSDRSSWVYLGDAAPLDIPEKNFSEYVTTLLKRENDPPPNFVCDSVYWAIINNDMVGRIAIRHELNDFLKVAGGHIGYIVRPSWRQKGIASEMLKQILDTDRAKLIGKLLLTCDDGNIASEKTIQKNGGILEGAISMGTGKPLKKRFWIQL